MIDWLCSYAISFGFFAADPAITLAIFAGSTILLQASLGTTIGHRITGLVVRTEHGTPPGLLKAAIRTVGLCLLIPVVIVDAQGRSLHDRWAGTYVRSIRG